MKEMTSKELKSCALGILLFIDNICKENDITYYLCGGTLLGAFRHKGFIPWDDDIDIMLPRADYDLFLRIFPFNERYRIMRPLEDKGYPYPYAKVADTRTQKKEYGLRSKYHLYGVDVDVFPIDSLPNSEEECLDYFKEIEKLDINLNCLKLKYTKGKTFFSTMKKFLGITISRVSEMLGLISIKKLLMQFDVLTRKYNSMKSDYCGITSISHYGIKERNKKKDYAPTISVEFEGHIFPSPSNYNVYLSQLYGKTYMQMPPTSLRVNHGIKAYWRD